MPHAGDRPREWWLDWILRIAVASTSVDIALGVLARRTRVGTVAARGDLSRQ